MSDALVAWRARVHDRVCVPARSCTCAKYTLEYARERAVHIHARYEHPGPVDNCQSPHDVICKAAWS